MVSIDAVAWCMTNVFYSCYVKLLLGWLKVCNRNTMTSLHKDAKWGLFIVIYSSPV